MASDDIRGRIAFVRVRVMTPLCEVIEGCARPDWVVQPISKNGKDIEGASCPWVPREALLTVEEIKEALQGKRGKA